MKDAARLLFSYIQNVISNGSIILSAVETFFTYVLYEAYY